MQISQQCCCRWKKDHCLRGTERNDCLSRKIITLKKCRLPSACRSTKSGNREDNIIIFMLSTADSLDEHLPAPAALRFLYKLRIHRDMAQFVLISNRSASTVLQSYLLLCECFLFQYARHHNFHQCGKSMLLELIVLYSFHLVVCYFLCGITFWNGSFVVSALTAIAAGDKAKHMKSMSNDITFS